MYRIVTLIGQVVEWLSSGYGYAMGAPQMRPTPNPLFVISAELCSKNDSSGAKGIIKMFFRFIIIWLYNRQVYNILLWKSAGHRHHIIDSIDSIDRTDMK